MFRRRLSQLLLALVMVVLAACEVEASVQLDVREDGSGTVEVDAVFDEAAVDALGGVEDQLRTSDLAQAGWTVEASEDEGTARIQVSKDVARASEWQSVLDEVAGPGVFTDVEVTTSDRFAEQTAAISFNVDLRQGWGLFSDDDVAAALNGQPFGAPIESLTGGRPIDEIVTVQVTSSVSSADGGPSASSTSRPRFDDADPTAVKLSSTTENSTAVLLRWVAIALGSLFVLATVLAVTGIVLQRRSDRLRPVPTPSSLASRVPGATAAAPTTSAPTPSPARAPESVRLVVVEPLSVLYQQSQSIDVYLLPYVRHNGGEVRADTILDGYESLVAGSMDTEAFWTLCGVAGDAPALDETYLQMRRLRPGVADFLDEMQRRRIPVAAASNDGSTWSEMTRERDRLSGVWPWLVSADVGAKKPDFAIFEIMRRESGVAHGHCLYVDTNIDNLDAAKQLGMKTALFDAGDFELPEVVGHPRVTDFKGLFGK